MKTLSSGLLLSLAITLLPLDTSTNLALPTVAVAQSTVALPIEGVASWYGPGFVGRLTANGERFNPAELTAAHKTLPFGTRLRVVNLTTGRSVVVRINDRGPYAGNRIIDLSREAARQIGMIDDGVAQVRLEPLTPAPALATDVTTPPDTLIASSAPQSLSRQALATLDLANYDIATNDHEPGELLLLRSATQSEPIMVRVVAYENLDELDADILLSEELFAMLGGDVFVIDDSGS